MSSHPLTLTPFVPAATMPTIEEVDDFSDPDDVLLDESSVPVIAGTSTGGESGTDALPLRMPSMPGGPGLGVQKGYKQVEESVYKDWDTIYPIYIDSKRPFGTGSRRVNNKIALEWPVAEHMAQACGMLGIEAVLEPMKSHPKDWANPGRVKVQLKKDGQPLSKAIPNSKSTNKRTLLKRICLVLKPHDPPSVTLPSGRKKLAPLHLRLPAMSPAISHGALEQAMNGGGMAGMLGNMLGGQGGDDDAEPAKKPEPQIKVPPKPRKIVMKKRR
ncbi:signal recognition particle subunit [Microbotryomycetes sp. JL201]|nr:signal recognition particle subunit [Microbotryomycetes sp. JL201]